jgi:hypothetical protein
VSEKRLAGGGDANGSRGAAEQTRAEPLFQTGEAATERGPGDAQLFRSTGQRAGLDGAHESLDLGRFQQIQHLDQNVADDDHLSHLTPPRFVA